MFRRMKQWSFQRFRFHKAWQQVLESDAKTYTGLFAGLQRVADGTAKKPEKILKEWCTRTEARFGDSPANIICHKRIIPLLPNGNSKKYKKIAERLLLAADAANIRREESQTIFLSWEQLGAYINLDEDELFEGDAVAVVSPAWYQNETVIEQGYCRKQKDGGGG